METYLVGGAVRDQLLKLPVTERDWVVVGSTPEAMLAAGFSPVGKDFPVFLHPKTKEEYALARTERKTAKGYKGFTFHAAPDITLKEDLRRRDLTINAIAQAADGTLIDPFDGAKDIVQKQLRHVSLAFAEDPVRILRLARFAAKLPDFTIHPDTLALMQQLVDAGEVDALVSERVWKECEKALQQPAPERFFEVLNTCGALLILWPTLRLPTQFSHHPDPRVRLCVAMQHLPLNTAKQYCRTMPKAYSDPLLLLLRCKNLPHRSAEEQLNFIERSDGLRRPERFELLLTCLNEITPQNFNTLRQAHHRLTHLSLQPVLQQGLKGNALTAAIRNYKISHLSDSSPNSPR